MRYTAILLVLIVRVTLADSTTIGPDGIDSKATGLDGTNVEIGQVEPGRSAKPNFGVPPEDSASNTKPEQVYFRTQLAATGEANDEHATLVAGVMIGDASVDAVFQGVAIKAKLHSAAVGSGSDDEFPTDVDRDFALTANNLARLSGPDPNDPNDPPHTRRMRAINVSAARTLQIAPVENLDGNTHITLFVDWSARVQDILYVIAWGNNNSQPKRVPQDNFNGMTIAASQPAEGSSKYTKFGTINATVGQPDGTRYAISLIAPGQPVAALGHNDELDDIPRIEYGTSLAAPHVTATAALLQQCQQSKWLCLLRILDLTTARSGMR